MADTLNLPLQYVRKQTRGLGTGSQMVSVTQPSARLLLVDDLLAAGTSKVNFVRAIRSAGATVKDIFVIFDYGTFTVEALLGPLNVSVHSLANWADVLAARRDGGDFDVKATTELEAFLANPARWSEVHGGISQHL